MVRSKIFYTSSDGYYTAGIWESKTGSMKITDFPATEIMYIVEGGLMHNAPGKNPIVIKPMKASFYQKGETGHLPYRKAALK
jgi:uncharacterized cupin superfamily protein